MVESWARGERPRVEEVLALCPELAGHDESVARLVERELMLRREWGEPDRAAELARRYPTWAGPFSRAIEPSEATACPPIDADPPAVGEELGEFHLEAELGRGSRGYVFLATQPSLADRPVVLKVTPCDGGEHLALARLQHPHVVPLHGLCDLPARGLRVLCMPYLGGVPLSRLLDMLRFVPPATRSGHHLLHALESAEAVAPIRVPAEGPARLFLAHTSFDRAICWIGSCLADALDSAHRRQLLHLDVKPSNVLLASDGRPMLLDFHLARGPIHAGSAAGCGLGGTLSYMPPEQRNALEAVRAGRAVPADVDARADVYSLGLVLHESLGGTMPRCGRSGVVQPQRSYPGVDAGLAAIVAKCLAPEPADRYPGAAALASDLRRQLADQPLRGVAGHSLADRWKRWRRRRPHALARGVLLVGAVMAMAVATTAVGIATRGRLAEAARALAVSRADLAEGDFAGAMREAEYGLGRLGRMPFVERARRELDASLRAARWRVAVEELHTLAEAARRLDVADAPGRTALEALNRRIAEAWAARGRVLDDAAAPGLLVLVRDDLLTLAVARSLICTRLAPPGAEAECHREAIRILDEAEAGVGRHAVLARERGLHARALGLSGGPVTATSPTTCAAMTPWAARSSAPAKSRPPSPSSTAHWREIRGTSGHTSCAGSAPTGAAATLMRSKPSGRAWPSTLTGPSSLSTAGWPARSSGTTSGPSATSTAPCASTPARRAPPSTGESSTFARSASTRPGPTFTAPWSRASTRPTPSTIWPWSIARSGAPRRR